MPENPVLELSRKNLDRFYAILKNVVGFDSLDRLFFETAVEDAFQVKLPAPSGENC